MTTRLADLFVPGVPDSTLLVEGSHPADARIHKWEARKDEGVVAAWIEASTRPGDLVIDPFSGSGTSPLAAARAGRRALGIDLNPLAIRIARLVASPPDPAAVEAAFFRVVERVRRRPTPFGDFAAIHAARCPCCKESAELAHAVWSVRIACGCGAITPAHLLPRPNRGGSGGRRCLACGEPPLRGGEAYRGEELQLLFVRCARCGLQEARPNAADRELAVRLESARELEDPWMPLRIPLRYPDGTPFAQLRHALRARPVLDELWTGRNLLSTALLAEAIAEESEALRDALLVSLSSIVKATSRMPTINSGGWRNKGTGLSSHLLGIFPEHLEQNALEEFERHVRRRLLPGLRAARKRPAVRLVDQPLEPSDLSLRCGDATEILAALPAASAGFVFADPPYGDAVQYAELAFPQLAWLQRPKRGEELEAALGGFLRAVVANEVVENRAQGKDRRAFASRLGALLGQARRVLIPGRACVLTFNSPDESLVRLVIELAEGAGLRHAGTHRQPSFKPSHKSSWHGGSARGTLYLRFL